MKANRFVLSSVITVSLLLLAACNIPTTPGNTGAGGGEVTPAAGTPADASTMGDATVVAETPAESSASASSAMSGNCANQYYPVAAGATWNYSMSSDASGTSSFVRSIGSVSDGGFTDQDVFSGGTTRTGSWSCDNGDLAALDQGALATVSVPTDSATPTFTAQSTESSGITIPATMTVGVSWSQSVTIEGSMEISGMTADATNAATYTCTPAGMESVSVAAGTFDAMKVTCVYQMNITVNMDSTGPMSLPFSSTSDVWFAPNVGMVKTVDQNSDLGDTTIELTDYSIPGL